ncbi:MAG: amino acid ABC transporter permease [Zetaproteobacteria bacterium]|nr:amino acid ABC transporter permease [Zetaproteobacteria bacterium]
MLPFIEILATLAEGVAYTVWVTVVCSVTGVGVGLTVVALRKLEISSLTIFLDVFTYVFRAVPLLVMLFIVYFGFPSLGVKLSPLLAMVLSLGVIAGAYLGEVYRGALQAVDDHEILAAQSMGFNRWQILLLIEFPQMLRFSFPGMVNEFTTVLKYSPFAYTVGMPEITKQAMALTGVTNQGIEIYLAAGLLYFAIYRILLLALQAVENYWRIPGMKPL